MLTLAGAGASPPSSAKNQRRQKGDETANRREIGWHRLPLPITTKLKHRTVSSHHQRNASGRKSGLCSLQRLLIAHVIHVDVALHIHIRLAKGLRMLCRLVDVAVNVREGMDVCTLG